MKYAAWLLFLAAVGAGAFTLWKWRERWQERKRAAEGRFATFIAQARPPVPVTAPAPVSAAAPEIAVSSVPLQKLLFEAAAKAGEAGEPVLSIQLYARLLARYPDSAFGAQARAAVDVQKKKLATR